MYKLYRDTDDYLAPYYIIVKGGYPTKWYKTIHNLPSTFTPSPLTTYVNLDAYGPLKLLYSGKSYPSTPYLKQNHPELFI